MAGLPPALSYLSQLDQLIVKQKKELMESKLIPRGEASRTLIYGSAGKRSKNNGIMRFSIFLSVDLNSLARLVHA